MGEPIKRVIRVVEWILEHEGRPGYDPERMVLGWGRGRRRFEKRLIECSDCPKWLPRRKMVEVTEEHESLTWFAGDLLCYECACAHGIL